MNNPLVKKDLLEAILALREDVERRLRANKFYIALHKIDEMLVAIQPLDVSEAAASKSPATNEEPAAAPAEPAQAEPAPAESAPAQSAPAEVPEERTWTGVVQEPLGEPSWRQTAAS